NLELFKKRNHKLKTTNSKPRTQNPKPESRNPDPSFLLFFRFRLEFFPQRLNSSPNPDSLLIQFSDPLLPDTLLVVNVLQSALQIGARRSFSFVATQYASHSKLPLDIFHPTVDILFARVELPFIVRRLL